MYVVHPKCDLHTSSQITKVALIVCPTSLYRSIVCALSSVLYRLWSVVVKLTLIVVARIVVEQLWGILHQTWE